MTKHDLREAIEKKKIISFSDGPKLVSKEIAEAEDDLEEAKGSFKRERYKWATVQAYYSFFHISRALLYSRKYREKSHFHLALAIKVLFVDEGLLPVKFYDNLTAATTLREAADYKGEFSKDGAARNIKVAEGAIKIVKDLLIQ